MKLGISRIKERLFGELGWLEWARISLIAAVSLGLNAIMAALPPLGYLDRSDYLLCTPCLFLAATSLAVLLPSLLIGFGVYLRFLLSGSGGKRRVSQKVLQSVRILLYPAVVATLPPAGLVLLEVVFDWTPRITLSGTGLIQLWSVTIIGSMVWAYFALRATLSILGDDIAAAVTDGSEGATSSFPSYERMARLWARVVGLVFVAGAIVLAVGAHSGRYTHQKEYEAMREEYESSRRDMQWIQSSLFEYDGAFQNPWVRAFVQAHRKEWERLRGLNTITTNEGLENGRAEWKKLYERWIAPELARKQALLDADMRKARPAQQAGGAEPTSPPAARAVSLWEGIWMLPQSLGLGGIPPPRKAAQTPRNRPGTGDKGRGGGRAARLHTDLDTIKAGANGLQAILKFERQFTSREVVARMGKRRWATIRTLETSMPEMGSRYKSAEDVSMATRSCMLAELLLLVFGVVALLLVPRRPEPGSSAVLGPVWHALWPALVSTAIGYCAFELGGRAADAFPIYAGTVAWTGLLVAPRLAAGPGRKRGKAWTHRTWDAVLALRSLAARPFGGARNKARHAWGHYARFMIALLALLCGEYLYLYKPMAARREALYSQRNELQAQYRKCEFVAAHIGMIRQVREDYVHLKKLYGPNSQARVLATIEARIRSNKVLSKGGVGPVEVIEAERFLGGRADAERKLSDINAELARVEWKRIVALGATVLTAIWAALLLGISILMLYRGILRTGRDAKEKLGLLAKTCWIPASMLGRALRIFAIGVVVIVVVAILAERPIASKLAGVIGVCACILAGLGLIWEIAGLPRKSERVIDDDEWLFGNKQIWKLQEVKLWGAIAITLLPMWLGAFYTLSNMALFLRSSEIVGMWYEASSPPSVLAGFVITALCAWAMGLRRNWCALLGFRQVGKRVLFRLPGPSQWRVPVNWHAYEYAGLQRTHLKGFVLAGVPYLAGFLAINCMIHYGWTWKMKALEAEYAAFGGATGYDTLRGYDPTARDAYLQIRKKTDVLSSDIDAKLGHYSAPSGTPMIGAELARTYRELVAKHHRIYGESVAPRLDAFKGKRVFDLTLWVYDVDGFWRDVEVAEQVLHELGMEMELALSRRDRKEARAALERMQAVVDAFSSEKFRSTIRDDELVDAAVRSVFVLGEPLSDNNMRSMETCLGMHPFVTAENMTFTITALSSEIPLYNAAWWKRRKGELQNNKKYLIRNVIMGAWDAEYAFSTVRREMEVRLGTSDDAPSMIRRSDRIYVIAALERYRKDKGAYPMNLEMLVPVCMEREMLALANYDGMPGYTVDRDGKGYSLWGADDAKSTWSWGVRGIRR